jgi:nicotinamide-nucleotide amidase
MRSKIISIGDEILIGQIINTNASFVAEKLFSAGIPCERIVVIGDEESELIKELEDSMENFDVTVITGGLGPTHDDITKPVLVKYFGDKLVRKDDLLEHIKKIFETRNIEMPKINEAQAEIPEHSKVIWNDNGTAPGHWIEKSGKIVIALPGVPYEMKPMLENKVIPELKSRYRNELNYVLKQKTLLTTGITESGLYEKFGDIKNFIEDNKLAFLPSAEGVRIRINVIAQSEIEADNKIRKIEEKIRNVIGEYIYGIDNDLLEGVMGKILIEKNLTLSVAESCTGGRISSRIVNIPGSSQYYMGGVCTYSNKEKVKILNVDKGTLEKSGAVSEETAKEMAAGVRSIMETHIGISTTGIAGPDGGSKEKPVGLVWIGYSDKNKTYAKKFLFGNNRERNIARASQMALEILRRELSNIEIKF